MNGFTAHTLPAEITVFAGSFASQPLAFAHLADAAPALDLDHVEVIGPEARTPRLAGHFDPPTRDAILAALRPGETCLLILPAAFDGLVCPLGPTDLLRPLGPWRGTVTRLIPSRRQTP